MRVAVARPVVRAFEANGQSWYEENPPAPGAGGGGGVVAVVCTAASGVIESSPPLSGCVTSATIWSPVSVAATPVIDENWSLICWRRILSPSCETAACAAVAAACACVSAVCAAVTACCAAFAAASAFAASWAAFAAAS